MPAPKKQCDDDRRTGDHRRVFAKKIQRELHRAVLGVVTASEFLLSFGQIEWQAIRLGKDCNHEHEKGNEHGYREQPFPWVRPIADKRRDEPAMVNLVPHDGGQA